MTTLDNQLTCAAFGPRLTFERSRWASFREESVNTVTEIWAKRPNLVQIMDDPRLGSAKLVMMRKDLFEQLVSAVDGFVSGRSAIRVEIDRMTKITTVLKSMIANSEAATLAEVVLETAQQLSAQVVPAGPVNRLIPSDLSASEREFLSEQEKLDSEDED